MLWPQTQDCMYKEEEEKVMIEQTEVGSRDIKLGMFYFWL
jgi:hypothetical protein